MQIERKSLIPARVAKIRRLHHDENGTISIVTVFTMLMFTMVLVMVTNLARHADNKIRMQNAADAATQTGGVVLARGINSIAFTNHLLCEVFALTAYMREAKQADQGTASLVPEILEEWRKTGQVFEQVGESVGYGKFQRLGAAIQQKVPLEQNVVDSFLLMSAEHSRLTLPALESILGGPNWSGQNPGTQNAPPPDPEGGFIPRFQRAVVQNIPIVAQLAANEIAQRHGGNVERQHDGRPLESRLWRTDVQVLGQVDETDPLTRTIPAIDASPTGPDESAAVMQARYGGGAQTYFEISLRQRRDLSEHYLRLWISDFMGEYFDFDDDNDDFVLHGSGDTSEGMITAKMSNLLNLWRSATCEHLNDLLSNEYPFTNVPHVIRSKPEGISIDQDNDLIQQEYSHVGVAYWSHLTEMAPGLFQNPLKAEANTASVAFTQTMLYVPRARLVKRNNAWVYGVLTSQGWQPVPYIENWPASWDLINQNWMVRSVPATSVNLLAILQQSPGGSGIGYNPPRLNGVTLDEMNAVNTH